MMIGGGQSPGKHGADCVTVLSSVAEAFKQAGSKTQGAVQVITRHTTGP